MAYPFFSLSKSHRVTPIDFRMGEVAIRVEATAEHGMATIWDADVLIWAASQLVEARDKGLRTSRLMAATPYEILTFIGRGTSVRDYQRLKSALDRLSVDDGRNDTATAHGAAHASLLLAQRVGRSAPTLTGAHWASSLSCRTSFMRPSSTMRSCSRSTGRISG